MAGGEEGYRAIVETALDGIYQVDTSGKLTFVNAALARTFGYKREELLGIQFSSLLSAETLPRVVEMVEEVLRGKNVRDEVPVQHKDGHEVPVNFGATPLRDRGKIVGLTGILRDVTEQKRTEKALRESEEKYKALVEAAARTGEGMVVLQNIGDREGALVFVNDEFCRMLGYSQEELLAMSARDLIPAADYRNILERYRQRQRGEDVIGHYEVALLRKDGTSVLTEVGLSTMPYSGEISTVAFLRDITERKQTEKMLLESEARYRALFECSLEGIVISKGSRIILANKALLDMLGYKTVEELNRIPVPDHVAPAYRQTIVERIRQREKGEPLNSNYTCEFLTREGEIKYFEVSVNEININGEGCVLSCFRDMTERRRAQEALQKSEERYRTLYESSRDGIAAADLDGYLTECNQAYADMLGYSREELKVIKFLDITPPNYHAANEAYVRQVMMNGHASEFEKEYIRKDGTIFPVSLHTWRIDDDAGNPAGVWSIVRDITRSKKLEETLKESEGKYRNLFNNAQVGLFRSRISDGKILECSDLLATMFGYKSREECIAEHITSKSYVDPEARAHELKQLTERGEVKNFETLVVRKDGSPFWISYSATIYPERDYIEGVVIDITERKKLEEALQFTRFALDNAVAEMVCVSQDGSLIDVNDAFCRAVGYSREELLSMTVHDVDPDYSAKIWPEFWKKLKRSGSLTFESCHRGKDGKVFPVEVTATFFEHKGKEYHCGFARDITERKKADETLRRSEEHLRALVENSHEAIVVLKGDGTISYGTPSIERTLGYTGEDLLGTGGFRFAHPDDMPKVMESFTHLMEDPSSIVHIELRIQHKDGSWRIVEAVARNLLENKAIEGIVINWRDITECKKAEEELHRLSDAVRMSTDSIVVTDMRWNILDGNEASVRMYGVVDRADLFGAKAFEIIAPEDREKAFEKMKEAMEKGYVSGLEYHVLTKDGRKILVEASTSLMKGSKGEPVGFVGVSRDITERKRVEEELGRYQRHLEELVGERTANLEDANQRLQHEIAERQQAEEALRASEERFRNIVESIPIPVVISRMSDGGLLYGNLQFVLLTGLSPEKLTGRKIWDFYDSPTKRKDVLNHLLGEAHIEEHEFQGKRADGTTFWAMASVRLLKFEGDDAVLTAFNDITARRKAEVERESLYQRERNLRQQLEEEMKKRVEFTRTLAHELKTPLTPVMLSSQELVAMLKDETSLRLAKTIERGASNLSSRIDELLDLAKGEIGMLKLKREYIDIAELLDDVVEEMSAVARSRDQKLFWKPHTVLSQVWADKVRVRQIVMNLLNNAFKFTPRQGQITVRAKREEHNLVIEVSDNGPGIKEQDQERLFNPYDRVEEDKERLSGLGLGLALC